MKSFRFSPIHIIIVLYFILISIGSNLIGFFIGDEITYSASVYSMLNGLIDANNHPLLAKSIWTYFAYLAAGLFHYSSPLAWRLGTIFFSLGVLAVFYKILTLYFNKSVSVVGVMFLAFDPIYFVFSRLLQLDIIFLFFNLSMLYLLLRYIKSTSVKYYLMAGLFLGLSLATKLTSLPLLFFIPLFFLIYDLKRRRVNYLISKNVAFTLLSVMGFVIGNISFFIFKHGNANFIGFTEDLFRSQLALPTHFIGYLNSPAWSFFTVPQIFTLYRLDYLKSVEEIIAFQNPVFFLLTIPTILLTLFLLVKNRLNNNPGVILILLFFFSEYVPWFSNIHMTFYYYVIPLLPLTILLFFNLIYRNKFSLLIMNSLLALSILVFITFYPLLTGYRVSKNYDLILYRYNLYNFTERDTIFCQHCSPRK